jgi:hypothetical protein
MTPGGGEGRGGGLWRVLYGLPLGLLTNRLHLIDRDAAGNGLAICMGFCVVKKAQGRFFFRVKKPDPQIQEKSPAARLCVCVAEARKPRIHFSLLSSPK